MRCEMDTSLQRAKGRVLWLKEVCLGVRSERDGLVLENLVKGARLRSTQKIRKVNFWVFPSRVNRGKKE